MTEIRVPTLGESVTEATIGRWFKKAGDAVAVDEPLVELETDKVTIEVPAPSRHARRYHCQGWRNRRVGALLGQINDGAGAAAKPAAASAKAAASPPVAAAAASVLHQPPRLKEFRRPTRRWAPSVRKISAESGLDAATVPARAGWRVPPRATCSQRSKRQHAAPTRSISRPPPCRWRAVAADDAAREERVKMTRLRQTHRAPLKDVSDTAAMLTTFTRSTMTPHHGDDGPEQGRCSRRSTPANWIHGLLSPGLRAGH